MSELEHELVAFRRRLHMHPEVSGQEVDTTEAIVERLRIEGLEPVVLSSGTGAVCDIDLRRADERVGPAPRVIALRADIDALAMDEDSDVEYRSRVPGAAHACGHDVHVAVVLGAAIALAQIRERTSRPWVVRVIFEPAEETVPGGAMTVIGDGWLESVDAIFGLHCDPKTDVGHVATRVGPITAAADLMKLTLTGPGGHTSRPHLTVDLVRTMSAAVVAIPDLVRQSSNADELAVVFGAVNAGHAANVIPSHAEALASVRTASTRTWRTAEQVVRSACAQALDSTGTHWQLEYVSGVPPVVNDEAATGLLRDCIVELLGLRAASEAPLSMGGDSFGWYTQQVPGSYARLGTHSPDSSAPRLDLHAARFDVDERAIAIGARVLALTALTGRTSG